MKNELICLSCFKNIYYEISFKNIFLNNLEREILCKNCKDNIFYTIEYEVIPLTKKIVHIYYLSNKNKKYFNDILEVNLLKNSFLKAYYYNYDLVYFPIYSKRLLNIFDRIFNNDFILITSKEREHYENYS